MRIGTARIRRILAAACASSGLWLAAAASAGDGEIERFNDRGRSPASSEAAPVCEVDAAGGPAAVAERDVAAVQQAIAATIEREMKPGVAGVHVDDRTILLNGRGYNYAPSRN